MVCLPWHESFAYVVLNAAVGFVSTGVLHFFIFAFTVLSQTQLIPQSVHKKSLYITCFTEKKCKVNTWHVSLKTFLD